MKRIFFILAIFLKWSVTVIGLAIISILAFTLGFRSWSPNESRLQAGARHLAAEQSTVAPSVLGRQREMKSEAMDQRNQLLEDATAAVRFGGKLGLGTARAMQLVEQLGPHQFANAFAAALEGERTSSREKIAGLILNHWATLDPNAAMNACAAAFANREEFLNRSYMPFLHFAKADPAGAFEAWKKYFVPLDKDYDNSTEFRLNTIFSEWGRQDFETAFFEFSKLNGEEAETALGGLLNTTNRDRTLELLKESGHADMLSAAREKIVGDLSNSGSHGEAIAWMDSLEIETGAKEPLEEEIAWGWFNANQREAAQWLIERSDDTNRSQRLAQIARRWVDWEANAAGEWLGEVMEQYGADADRAIRYFATGIARQDPATALDWIAAIQSPAERQKAAERVGLQFSQRLMEGVETWVENSQLNEIDRATVLAKSKQRRF